MRSRRPEAQRETIAFQGERGAFSEEAARKLVGENTAVLPCANFEDVFRSLKQGRVTGAVIPIENTLAGSVHENYDHLQNFELTIVAETNVRIVHNLIAPEGVKFSEIRRVFSHPVALNQCLKFFSANPQIQRVPFYDTAGSVKMISEERLRDAGAIASAVAAEIYGARILQKSIEDDRENFTRFFLLRRPRGATGSGIQRVPAGARGGDGWEARGDGPRMRGRVPRAPGRAGSRDGSNSAAQWKTSLVFSVRNVPGALFRTLAVFALRDLNLTKIESRPLRGKPWEYLFYLDFLGRADSPNASKALDHLREFADYVRVLGSYPKGA